MKIGIICSPTYGGSGVVATELGRCLAQRGHEIHFISVSMPFRLQSEAIDNVYFHEVQSISYPVLPGELHGISIASKAVQVVQDHGLDLLHAHYAIPHAISAWLASEILGGQGLRFVTTLHGTDITLVGKAPSFYPVAKFTIERSHAVTTVSDWLRQETVREFGITREIDVVPNFVDPTQFRRDVRPCKRSHFAPNGEKIILHASNFRPVKRVVDVVKVFAKVNKRLPCKLVMIGDGPDRDLAQKEARDHGIERHVHFLGKQERIEPFFSCADLMILPSEYESFGLAALEAMSCEMPVVSSNGGALSELIHHGETGFLADVGDVDAMAGHALEVLLDDDRRRAIGRAAREFVLANFRPEQIVPMYEEIYERALKSPAKPEPLAEPCPASH